MEKLRLKDMTLTSIFEQGGLLSKVIPGYSPRLPQIQAVQTVEKAFANNTHALIEAGTGTGKSYIVLFLAVLWSVVNEKKAVLSLPSQILQEQMFKEDVPNLDKALAMVEEDVKFALAIGRNNFVSLRKMNELYSAIVQDIQIKGKQQILTNQELEQFNQLLKATNPKEAIGYKGDVPFVPEVNLWTKINSTTDTCLGQACPFFEECKYFKNKKKVEDADVIISNNALLFADMSAKEKVGFDQSVTLPPYHLLVFDESHNLEKDATSFFKEEISSKEILDIMNALNYNKFITGEAHYKVQEISKYLKSVLSDTDKFMFNFLSRKNKQKASREVKDKVNENDDVVLSKPDLEQMSSFFTNIAKSIEAFRSIIKPIVKEVRSNKDLDKKEILESKKLFALENRLNSVNDKVHSIFGEEYSKKNLFFANRKVLENVYKQDRYEMWNLTKTPVTLGEKFQKNMFDVCDHVILLSATITTNNNFKYFRNRLGFKPTDNVEELVVDSPFDYNNNGKVYLLDNSPAANATDFKDFIGNFTVDILKKVRGGTFLLFTSNAQLEYVYNNFAPIIEKELNIKCLSQSQDSKAAVIAKFKEYQKPGSGYKSAILFAGTSFWEGVSVPGDDLMNVIITKLPFPVPTDPIIKARCELMEEQGENSFNEYLIPQATIPLKQAVGRLIRTVQDKGNIFILDNRLVHAKYKDKILNSLPSFQYFKLKV